MRPARLLGVVLAALVALVLLPEAARAHGDMEEPVPEPTMSEAPGPMATHLERAHLELRVPHELELGAEITITAILTDEHGMPIEGGTIAFERPAFWGEGMNGHMLIGEVTTDENGVATVTDQIRTSGDVDVEATFLGDDAYKEAMAEGHVEVSGDGPLYEPTAGIRVPWLNLWLLAGVIGLVWLLYLVVGARVLAIASAARDVASPDAGTPGVTRRQFLGRLLPLTAEAGIGLFGATLVGVVARSPHTHGNLMSAPATEATYGRTPVAFVGTHADMREMPMPLDREVSFSREVLPIFVANGGPHVTQPKSSPAPGGFRLDTYEHVMAKEGVVVPGKPQESEMIEHLLSPAMQMPPSLPPLPTDQIQVVVTWIAQGARDN